MGCLGGGGGALNELMQGNKYESFLKTLYSVSGSFKVYGNLTQSQPVEVFGIYGVPFYP